MKTEEMLEKIAEMNGVSIEEVKEEIQNAIKEAAMNPSPEFKKSFGDRVPSVEEFLSEMTSKAFGKLGN